MSVLKKKRSLSKAEFINVAHEIYIETIDFLTKLSARYSRLIAEPVYRDVLDGKAKQIATGEELLNTRSAVCSLLVDALTMEILREDYKAELKNSASASEPSS